MVVTHLSIMRILCFICLLLAVVVAKKDLKKLQIGVKVMHTWLDCRAVHMANGLALPAPYNSSAAAQA